ncbi:hypothetical protein BD324DRAFT_267264 [Kockovaella imperatae]|uniref:Calpain catalytic domain-containing protein n=1 Tax=Kockovaella imperatae TaxID=4999 RepID=A0A1Y1UQ89_9TREE|nr:hypothetical protein BD324DRAFT_267264 [Kockovaella imperatae]ORX40228.1 hypothetical protein BD324DRAFT_267264 [Kockovaella imperatae]
MLGFITWRLCPLILLLTLCSASAKPRRVATRIPKRPPPRRLVEHDPKWDHRWIKRDAPVVWATSTHDSSTVSYAISSAISRGPSSVHVSGGGSVFSSAGSGSPASFVNALDGQSASASASASGGSSADPSTSTGPLVSASLSTSAASSGISSGISASTSGSASQSQSLSSSLPSASASASASASSAANSSQLSGEGWHFPYTALWNGTAPNLEDVKQVRLANCWQPATSIALVYIAPEWVSHLITYSDGEPMAGESDPSNLYASVTLWNPNNGWSYQFPVNIYNESTTEDFPGGVWWHSALSQGLAGMAQMTPIVGMNSDGTYTQTNGSPAYALAMMTGRKVDYYTFDDYPSVDDFYEALSKASSTPVILATKYTTDPSVDPPLTANHDYAILSTSDKGAQGRYVNVRNPWGKYETFHVEAIYYNFSYLYMMEDQSELIWQGSQ